MSETDLAKVQGELKEIRRLVADALRQMRPVADPDEPYMFTLPQAAKKLGIGLTKLRQLIREHVIYTKPLGEREMVPRSELLRVSELPSAKRIAPRIKNVAETLAKVLPPSEAKRSLGIRMRSAMQPNRESEREKINALLKRRPKKNEKH